MNKYRAQKTTVDGITFDSKGEARRWQELKLLEKAGQLTDLKRQVPYQLTSHGKKIAKLIVDFEYTENGVTVSDDFKGMVTPVFRIKAKLFEAQYGRKIRISK